jgi:hypothetical protein
MLDACARLQFLINIRERWASFQKAMTAKEIWTTLQEHFRPPARIPIQRNRPPICESPRRRRGYPRACTAHGRILPGCPRVKSIRVPRHGRVPRHDALGYFAPVMVRMANFVAPWLVHSRRTAASEGTVWIRPENQFLEPRRFYSYSDSSYQPISHVSSPVSPPGSPSSPWLPISRYDALRYD